MYATMALQNQLGYHCALNYWHTPPLAIIDMAKEQTDRTTLDLFAEERRPGRPKTSPLSRDEQLRINKRNQLKRDKVNGLRRVELKLNEEAVAVLNQLAEEKNISRSELIEEILMSQLEQNAEATNK